MAFFLKGCFWLTLLGGAGVAIGLPTNDAVQSIFNKQEIRKSGGNGNAAKEYENYGYGRNGFGDSRTKLINNGQGKTEIESALTGVRSEWGKQNIGKGLEANLGNYIRNKKLCENGNSECYVGNIEFIDDKGKALYGRIPVQDKQGKKSNIYVKWLQCTKSTQKANSVGVGKFKKEEVNGASRSSSSAPQNNKGKGCIDDINNK